MTTELLQKSIGSNMWRKDGRIKIPKNGLAFYAPLWHPQLSGSTFNAWDLVTPGVISCTVTGATWGTTGRTFDGDDLVAMASSVTISRLAGTIIIWMKSTGDYTTNYASRALLLGNSAAEELRILSVSGAGTTPYMLEGENNTNSQYFVQAAGAVSKNVWHHIAIQFLSSTVKSYVDLALVDTKTVTDDVTFNRLGGIAALTSFFKGTEGEVLLYPATGLSLAQITQHYQATKWRYV